MPEQRANSSRIAELDGLRGIAIALVLWHHLIAPYLQPGRDIWSGWLLGATNLAWCGVDLFFVLSGFFIGGILLDQRDSPKLARVFYARRAARILPLYFVTLLAIFAAIQLEVPGAAARYPVWSYVTFFANFYQAFDSSWEWLALAVLWSLAVEEQFYLAAPWVARSLPVEHVPRLLLVLVLSAVLLRLAVVQFAPGRPLAAHVLMPMRMDALALGALAAWLARHGAGIPWVAALREKWRAAIFLFLLPVPILTLAWPKEGGLLLAAGGYTLIALGFAGFLLIVVLARPPLLVKALSMAPLVGLGRYSYFLYLWHGLLAVALIRTWGGPAFRLDSLPSLMVVAVALGVTIGAGIISWRMLEEPLIRLGRKFAY